MPSPTYQCTKALRVHEVKLVVDAREHLSNRSGVAYHANSAHDFGKVTTWHDSWWLVVDATFESCWGPIHKLNCTLGFDSCHACVHILGHHISTVHHAESHVLTMTRIALDHHCRWLKTGIGDLSDGELLVVCLLSRDDWCIACQHEVNTRIWHQVGLKLSDINIQRTIEAKRGCQRRNDLRKEAIQVCVCGTLNVKVATANVIKSLIVKHDSYIGMLKERMHTEHCVVGFNNSRCDLRTGPDSEAELGLLAIIDAEALQHEASKTRASASAASIEDHEALQASAVVCKLTNAVQAQVHNFLANGIMSAGKIVCGVLLTGDQLLRMEKLTIRASANLINHGWLQVNKESPGNMLASASL